MALRRSEFRGCVRSQHESSFTHQHNPAKNHLRHSKIADGLGEGFRGRFQQRAKLRREKSAGIGHLLLPLFRKNHSRWDGGAAFPTGAIS